jgi:hypothetical protein
VARLQFVYDQVLHEVERTGKDQHVRGVTEVLVARLRLAFGAGPLPAPSRDLRADAGHLARRQRVVI